MAIREAYILEDEQQLIQQAAQGDMQSYALIYRHYLPKLYKYLYEMIRSKEDTEEILQDIFLKLWEKRADLVNIISLNGYLFRIARNRLMNLYDHQKVQRKAKDYFEKQTKDYPNTTENNYVYKQYDEAVQVALRTMPQKRRQVFEMHFYQELSYEQIAQALNISKSMVKKHIYAANNYMKEYLKLNAGLQIAIAVASSMLFGL